MYVCAQTLLQLFVIALNDVRDEMHCTGVHVHVISKRKGRIQKHSKVLNTVFFILGKTQVRFSHTDVSMPDFSAYRREVSQDPNKPNTSEISRRAFTYLMVAGMGITGLHSGKNVVLDFLSTMSASADVLAMAKIEVDLTTIPEGKRCSSW